MIHHNINYNLENTSCIFDKHYNKHGNTGLDREDLDTKLNLCLCVEDILHNVILTSLELKFIFFIILIRYVIFLFCMFYQCASLM